MLCNEKCDSGDTGTIAGFIACDFTFYGVSMYICDFADRHADGTRHSVEDASSCVQPDSQGCLSVSMGTDGGLEKPLAGPGVWH